jgi:hypothetical protein
VILRHFMLHRRHQLSAAILGVASFAVLGGVGLVVAILFVPAATEEMGWVTAAGGAVTLLDGAAFLLFLISSGRFREPFYFDLPRRAQRHDMGRGVMLEAGPHTQKGTR